MTRVVRALIAAARQCAQTPVISITGVFGVKPRARRGLELIGDRSRRRFADRAAMLADQEHDHLTMLVIVDAGDERVAALDAMHEAVVARKSSAR